MPTWNKYADEVHAERVLIRAYGIDKLDQLSGLHLRTYKAQALNELARRLELEAELLNVRAELATAIDRMEAAECALDIARLPLERAPG